MRVPINEHKLLDSIVAVLLAGFIGAAAGLVVAAIVWNLNRKELKNFAAISPGKNVSKP